MDQFNVGDIVALRESATTRGRVVSVIDADTVRVEWQTRLGFEGQTIEERIRDLRRVAK